MDPMMLAICDTETSGTRFWCDNLLQVAIILIDTDGINVDQIFGTAEIGDLREQRIVFDAIKPIRPDEFQEDAIRTHRIGLRPEHKAMNKMELKYEDVKYAWDWILENHQEEPREIFHTIFREVKMYSVKGQTASPYRDEDTEIKEEPVYFVAANPAFDYPFMERYFAGTGAQNPFFYAPIDAKAYYSVGLDIPFKDSRMWQMARKLGHNLSGATGAHTALADAEALKHIVIELIKKGVKFQ
jgi:DNA polymerase III epsilon subunit-like protein